MGLCTEGYTGGDGLAVRIWRGEDLGEYIQAWGCIDYEEGTHTVCRRTTCGLKGGRWGLPDAVEVGAVKDLEVGFVVLGECPELISACSQEVVIEGEGINGESGCIGDAPEEVGGKVEVAGQDVVVGWGCPDAFGDYAGRFCGSDAHSHSLKMEREKSVGVGRETLPPGESCVVSGQVFVEQNQGGGVHSGKRNFRAGCG